MTSNIYKRSTLAGEFIVINTHLYNELASRGLWTKAVRESIMINNGSVQQLDVLDDETKAVFKTAWEVKQRALLDMSAVRAPYVCQSQSMNVFMEEPSAAKLTSLHFYSWRKGLKTGLYYLRTRPRATAQKFTIDPEAEAAALSKQKSSDGPVCTMSEGCVMCSA
jgi:ribonucleotide reductase alpha subunit